MIRRALLVPTVMGGAFNPENVAGIVYRWVADDLSGNDGDAIETWTDRIAAKALSQSTAGLRPLLRKAANGIGSKNALEFDGATSNRYMVTGVITDLNQPNTIFLVGKSDLGAPVAADHFFIDSGIATNTKRHAIFITNGTDNFAIYSGVVLDSGDDADTSAHVFTGLFNGASSTLRLDAVEIGAGNAGTQALGSINIGTYIVGNGYLDGLISEIIVYNAALSDTNRNKVEAYLMSYYGIT